LAEAAFPSGKRADGVTELADLQKWKPQKLSEVRLPVAADLSERPMMKRSIHPLGVLTDYRRSLLIS
jgi:hypothetical protein